MKDEKPWNKPFSQRINKMPLNDYIKNENLTIAYQIFANALSAIKIKTGNFRSKTGATHRKFSLKDSLAYIGLMKSDYDNYGSLKDVRGWDILEVGPGDNLGIPLLYFAAGANKVTALDRFYSYRDTKQQKAIYDALIARLPPEEQARAGKAFSSREECIFDPGAIDCLYGTGIDDPGIIDRLGKYDLIISRAVMMEVCNLEPALENLNKMLKPGGLMLHKVDFRDYWMFSKHHHPLTFLTLGDRLWKMMSSHRANSNRRLLNVYQEQFGRLGLTVLVPHRTRYQVPENDEKKWLDAIRKRLQPGYRDLPDDILLTSGAFIVAEKPVH
jgi:SAM-dependent methyltransferase